jgi:hypothetical protein
MSRYNHAAFKQTTYIIFEYFKKQAHSEKCIYISYADYYRSFAIFEI